MASGVPSIDRTGSLHRIESAASRLAAEYAAVLARRRPERSAVREIDGAIAVFAGVDSPLSKCTGVGRQGVFTERSVEVVEKFYEAHRISPSLELSPLAPETLTGILARRGYAEEYRLVVMTRQIDTGIDAGTAAGIEITSGDDAVLWADIVAAGFSGLSRELLLEIFTTNAAIPSVTRWLARVEGKIAGGGTLSIHDGVAHLFGTSVLPDFRRRGVQRSLLQARLRFARESGCDLATVAASPSSDSERNLLRNGFVKEWERVVMRRREG